MMKQRLTSMSGYVKVISERVDEIPIILAALDKMDLANQIDRVLTAHGNRQGLSFGQMATIWLTYIISNQDHRMSHVQDWVQKRRLFLQQLIGVPISPTDFTDDRLADLLRYLSIASNFNSLERALTQHTIRVYNLELNHVRLDATSDTVYHQTSNIFQFGRTKAGTYDTQFKMMLATLDPLSLPIAIDTVAGNLADDTLYLPVYQRVRQTLDQAGLLYIGDCKMAALNIRATIAHARDFYLMPLPMTGKNPDLLEQALIDLENEIVELTDLYLPEDLPDDSQQETKPEDAIAQAFEYTRTQQAVVDGQEVTWPERVLVVRSPNYAQAQSRSLEARLARAEEQLRALTPPPGRGRKQFREVQALQIKVSQILERFGVREYFEITLTRQQKERQIRAYAARPARVEVKVRYQLDLLRLDSVIDQSKKRLGWRLYVTNEKVKRLTLSQAVLAYRQQYIVERGFTRLKGSLAITPLYVQRDDHAQGLMHLLSLALRAMVLIEFEARRKLAEEEKKLSGIYAGNPKRATSQPTTESLLSAFKELTLSIHSLDNEPISCYLTPLTNVQTQILRLLDLPTTLYTDLASVHQVSSPFSSSAKSRPTDSLQTGAT